jgi:hypothetical protein
VDSNQRRPCDDDLCEVVIEVMLDAGDAGVTTFSKLLEKIALQRRKWDGASSGPMRLNSQGPGADPESSDPERVVEVLWDLARQGTLTFGYNAQTPDWPAFRRSRFGERALRHDENSDQSRIGRLKTLHAEAPDISPETAVFLKEAVAAFYMDCQLAACAMLSIAAESEFLRLLSAAKSSAIYGQHFSRIGDSQTVAAKISQFKEVLSSIRSQLPKPATDELDHNLETVQSVIRIARSESGRPSGAPPPSRDQVYLYLQLFISFARQALRLRRELNERPYPRIVRLH